MTKALHIVCIVAWSICLGFAVISLIQGTDVNALTAVCPTLVCISHNAEKLFGLS